MAFTRIPLGDNSTAIALVIPSIAVLLALYAITFGKPYCAAMELILIIQPDFYTKHMLYYFTADTKYCRYIGGEYTG